MNIKKMLHDNVLVKELEDEKKSPGGIWIPDTAKKTLQCRVVSVGPGKHTKKGFVPTQVNPGDIVLKDEYAGTKIMIDGEEYQYMQEAEILAVV